MIDSSGGELVSPPLEPVIHRLVGAVMSRTVIGTALISCRTWGREPCGEMNCGDCTSPQEREEALERLLDDLYPRKRVAWWDDWSGPFSYRRFLHFHGFHTDVDLNDRLVQGEPVENLIAVLEGKIENLEKAADPETCVTRGRYGHYYPDHDLIQRFHSNIRRHQGMIEQMKSGTFGPTHTIEVDEEGNYLFDTVQSWRTSNG